MNDTEFSRYYYFEWFIVIVIYFGLILWLYQYLVKNGFISPNGEKNTTQRAITLLVWIPILDLFSLIPFFFGTDTFSTSSSLGMLLSPLVASYSILIFDRIMLKGLFKGIFGIISFILAIPYIIFTILDTLHAFDSSSPRYYLYISIISLIYSGINLIQIISMIILTIKHKFDKKTCIFLFINSLIFPLCFILYQYLKNLILGPSDMNNFLFYILIDITYSNISGIIGFIIFFLAIRSFAFYLKNKS